tara:strand:+ start:200 stop:373 length:174 start_codon:yes stop_codon:yes gene_type:complete
MAIIFIMKDIQPAPVFALLTNLVMRITYDWEWELPSFFSLRCETVWFAGNPKNFAAR